MTGSRGGVVRRRITERSTCAQLVVAHHAPQLAVGGMGEERVTVRRARQEAAVRHLIDAGLVHHVVAESGRQRQVALPDRRERAVACHGRPGPSHQCRGRDQRRPGQNRALLQQRATSDRLHTDTSRSS
jgi:hypothetical protein